MIVPPGTPTPGRARSALPLRREGPEKLTGLAKYADDRIRIQGHTDSTGSVSHNEELSMRRAQSVREVLGSRGVKPEQMLVEGIGEAHPIADNRTAAGRSQNRRVELHIDIPQNS